MINLQKKKQTNQGLFVKEVSDMENKIIIAETERLILRRYKKDRKSVV